MFRCFEAHSVLRPVDSSSYLREGKRLLAGRWWAEASILFVVQRRGDLRAVSPSSSHDRPFPSAAEGCDSQRGPRSGRLPDRRERRDVPTIRRGTGTSRLRRGRFGQLRSRNWLFPPLARRSYLDRRHPCPSLFFYLTGVPISGYAGRLMDAPPSTRSQPESLSRVGERRHASAETSRSRGRAEDAADPEQATRSPGGSPTPGAERASPTGRGPSRLAASESCLIGMAWPAVADGPA